MSDRPSSSSYNNRRSRSPDRESNRETNRDRDRRRSRSRSPSESTSKKSKHSHRDRDRDSGSSKKEKGSSSRRNEDNEEEREERIDKPLPVGVGEIDESDYFLKSTELKVWLDEFKGRKLDQLSGEDARRYFRKFVKSWNRGQLDSKFYNGINASSISASTSSSFSWSFSKATQRELDDASSIRKSIDGTTVRSSSSFSSNPKPVLGPSFPPTHTGSALAALQNSREAQAAQQALAKAERKDGYRKEARESREEERDNRSTGRERQMEKRREGNAVNKSIRDDREGGGMLEVDDDFLMGGSGGSSFAAMVAARDRRPPSRKMQAQEEKAAYISDKVKEYRTKEDATMAQFRELAAAKFGPK